MSKRLAALLALLALAGCGTDPAQPAQPPPMQRVLVESQTRAFADRVIAELGLTPAARMRAAVEADGRAVCSHMIAGVPVEEAFAAAYPQATPDATGRTITRIASEALCPLQ